MRKIISILFATCLFLVSCNNEEEVYYSDMYLAIEVVDSLGNNLLGESSNLIHEGETKISMGKKEYYLNTMQDDNRITFRHIHNESHSYLKIGCWWGDCTNSKITIDWGADIEKDLIVFSYDSPHNGGSPNHDFRYPYSITINGKDLMLDEDSGHFIYIKDINP